MIKKWLLPLAAVLLFFGSLAHASNKSTLTPITLSLKWAHQFQFAGYYMAKERGYYQDAGLEVTFLEATPSTDPIQRVVRGEAQFGVGTSDLILNAAKGDPIVVLGVIMQHSPLGLVATDPAIRSVRDLRGKKLMIEENSAELFAFLSANGLSPKDYILHRHHLRLEDLIENKVNAISIYKTTELADLNEKNLPYRVFYPIESGIDFYGDNLFTTFDMLKKHHKTVEDFREASFRGWKYAMEHPEETIRHILRHYVTNRSYEQLQFEVQQMQSLMQPDRIHPGKMTRNHWESIAQRYVDLGFIDVKPDMERFLYLPQLKFDEIYRKLGFSLAGLMVLLFMMVTMGILLRYFILQKKRYQTLFHDAPLAILVLDKHHQVIHWNKQAEQTFGWKRAEVIGRSIFDFLVENTDLQGVKGTLSGVQITGVRRQLINQNLTRDGRSITCSWTNAVFGDPKSQQIICMAIDLSEISEELPTKPQPMPSPSPMPHSASGDHHADPAETDPAEADPADEQAEPLSEADQLASIMQLSLFLWQQETGKTKVHLAEESQLWRVTLDGGTAKTRTLDKYLHAESIPNNPRWRTVIETARFVQSQRQEAHPELQELMDRLVTQK